MKGSKSQVLEDYYAGGGEGGGGGFDVVDENISCPNRGS